jgi:hypothetical protein
MIFLLQLVFQTLKLVWIIAKKILIILKILMYKFEIKESFDLAY